jgi:hypothetical protein
VFARFHKIRLRDGAIGGSVGSGREFTLHFVFLFLLFRHNKTIAYHPGGLQTSNLALGGACTYANPRAKLSGCRFYSNQDCPRIGLVGVLFGWECSPTI